MTSLYEQDFAFWAEEMAKNLAQRSFDKLDIIKNGLIKLIEMLV